MGEQLTTKFWGSNAYDIEGFADAVLVSVTGYGSVDAKLIVDQIIADHDAARVLADAVDALREIAKHANNVCGCHFAEHEGLQEMAHDIDAIIDRHPDLTAEGGRENDDATPLP